MRGIHRYGLLLLLWVTPSGVWAQEVECEPHDLAINRASNNQMVASASAVQCVSEAILLCRKPLRMIEFEELGWGPGREESP